MTKIGKVFFAEGISPLFFHILKKESQTSLQILATKKKMLITLHWKETTLLVL
jgi:hypothetical protein